MTSVLQPMDAGIIRAFKSSYKKFLVDSFLKSIELNGQIVLPNIKESLYMIKNSWVSISRETICNC